MPPFSAEQARELMDAVARGELPDASLKDIFFPPEKREVSLQYAEKMRREDVIANTLAVPFQPVRCFAPEGSSADCDEESGWHNRLIWGDNLQAMKSLLELKRAGKLKNEDGSDGIRLIYIDPPFATKQEFRGNQDQKAYADKIAGAKFIEAMRRRLIMMYELLSDDGSLYLHLDTKKVHYLKLVLDEIFGESNFQSEIVWKRINAKGNVQRKWGAVHESLLFFSKNPDSFCWNQPLRGLDPKYVDEMYRHVEEGTGRHYRIGDLTAPASRASKGQIYEWKGYRPVPSRCWVYAKDKMEELERAGRLIYTKNGCPRFKGYLDESEGERIPDVWDDIGPALGNESIGYPTQKPEALLERIIRASSNAGDIVMDGFVGSGTTCAVAEKLGRRWIGIDGGKLAIYTAQKRLLSLKSEIGNKGKPLEARVWALHNAGHYDFQKLTQLNRKQWRFFALQLFECSDQMHSVNGLKCDGKKGVHSVLVFDHHANPDDLIDEDYVDQLHERVGKKVGHRFYIVAKRGAFDFQEDYLERDGVRYYALRIPYSFIEELHKTKFSNLRQSASDGVLNDLQEAVGFDFIETPDLDFRVGCQQPLGRLIPDAILDTTHFSSRAKTRNGHSVIGFDSLAMILIDCDYNGKTFDFDRAFYGVDLKGATPQGRARWPLHETGARVAVIWVDIHGNESFQVVPRDAFDAPVPQDEVPS